jgi:DNA-binding CsgD family transcriptional regulator
MRMDGSPLPVAHHPRLSTHLPPDISGGEAASAAPPPIKAKGISAAEANEALKKKKAPPPKSAVGLLLMDGALNLISSNVVATQILSYPNKLVNLRRQELYVIGKIRSILMNRQPLGESSFATEFRSGRRRYFCRAFLVDSEVKDPARPSIAVLLERGPSGLLPLSQVSQEFNLTQREREVLEYLLQGLSSKEIANRMNISSNTVKAFLRLIMIKTGESSRSAVIRKIIMTQPQQ